MLLFFTYALRLQKFSLFVHHGINNGTNLSKKTTMVVVGAAQECVRPIPERTNWDRRTGPDRQGKQAAHGEQLGTDYMEDDCRSLQRPVVVGGGLAVLVAVASSS